MLLSLRKNGLTSLFKEVRVYKGTHLGVMGALPKSSLSECSPWGRETPNTYKIFGEFKVALAMPICRLKNTKDPSVLFLVRSPIRFRSVLLLCSEFTTRSDSLLKT